MKNDRYTKIVLTVIAVCLIWICIRDIKIGPKILYANNTSPEEIEVYVRKVAGTALALCEPISVEVSNWSDSLKPTTK